MASQVSCCEFHFRCDILLQNFIFNLCTYYTQLATPPHLAAGPLIWLLFLFLVKLFYFCDGNCYGQPEIRKAASVRVQVRVYLSSSVGFQARFSTLPRGLLIIITGIMTGFHWDRG